MTTRRPPFRSRVPVGWATGAGRLAAVTSRFLGVGSGSVIAGRVALALRPDLLGLLADEHTTVVVTGTNGETTTSHLIVAALGGREAMAHNAAGSNMPDGAVTALMTAPTARRAVLEIDELHLGEVLGPLRPRVVVLLNLSRDQLDRSSEVRATAHTIHRALAAHPGSTVVANADDPMVVHAVGDVPRIVWVAAGSTWPADTRSCPACGELLVRDPVDPLSGPWWCTTCALGRPEPAWWSRWTSGESTVQRGGEVPVGLRLAKKTPPTTAPSPRRCRPARFRGRL
jgi:lipid II isoglutaminyl synthase (glutamine-hydrolysing)